MARISVESQDEYRLPEGEPLGELHRKVTEYLYLPRPDALITVLGALAGNMMDGSPCWLMLVGAPSIGKTELINCLLDVNQVFEQGDISGPAAFLSASSRKDRSPNATGGTLEKVGNHGAILINDFTSILSLPVDRREGVMAVFREAYSGRWTRSVGEGGGRDLNWRGRLGVIAGCTGKIDQHHALNAELGERWVYYRLDGEEASNEADYVRSALTLKNIQRSHPGSEWQGEVRARVARMYLELDLGFDGKDRRRPKELGIAEIDRLISISKLAAKCRSAVVRDHYTKEIVTVREAESSSRLTGALGQLYLGMEAIGTPGAIRWRVVGKAALDSMPKVRRVVVDELRQKEWIDAEELARVAGSSQVTMARAAEELEVHGVVESKKAERGRKMWGLREDIKEEIRKARL